jgi:hypothetical protein
VAYLIQALTFVWNELTDEVTYEDVQVLRDKIIKTIPNEFSICDDDDDEEESESTTLVEEIVPKKRVYLCGLCKKKGIFVPKKGHRCPSSSYFMKEESN